MEVAVGIDRLDFIALAESEADLRLFAGVQFHHSLVEAERAHQCFSAVPGKEYLRHGLRADEHLTIEQMLREDFQGIRPAVGYPSMPDTSMNFLLDRLLDMKTI